MKRGIFTVSLILGRCVGSSLADIAHECAYARSQSRWIGILVSTRFSAAQRTKEKPVLPYTEPASRLMCGGSPPCPLVTHYESRQE
jgi:hypothetical protein